MGFFHTHRWKYVYVRHYYDTSYSSKGAPSYQYIMRCKDCGKTKSDDVYYGGFPTVEQLNGEG